MNILITERGISVTIYEKKQIELAQLQNSFEKEKAKENPRIRQEDIETKQKEINNIENTVDHFDRKAKIHVKDSEDKFYKKCLKSSSVGDTIGDALKDMSGPFLMVIIKLLPAICIVSCHYFINTSYLIQD